MIKKGPIMGHKTLLVLLVALNLISSPVMAASISAQSSAELIVDQGNEFNGWYRYETKVQWDFSDQHALSHWDVLLKMQCLGPEKLIEFGDLPDGFSNSEEFPNDYQAIQWNGFFLRTGDPTIQPGTMDPVVKYEPYQPISAEVPKVGEGTYWYYSNMVPEIVDYDQGIVAKAGQDLFVGTLQGAYPSCAIIPEPASMDLLSLGALGLFSKKRKIIR
jgi:hypothetical protein